MAQQRKIELERQKTEEKKRKFAQFQMKYKDIIDWITVNELEPLKNKIDTSTKFGLWHLYLRLLQIFLKRN